MDVVFYPILLGVAVVSGVTASISGFGIGSLLTPLIASRYGMQAAIAAVALPHALATAVRCWRMRAAIDWAVLRRFGLVSALGSLAGALTYANLGGPVLTRVLGALLVVTAVVNVSSRARHWQPRGRVVWALGLASGLFGGVAGNQGGIRAAALSALGLWGAAFVATSTATGLLVDAVRTPIYLYRAGATLVPLAVPIAVAAVGVLAGTIAGERGLMTMDPERFRRVVATLVGLLGLFVLLDCRMMKRTLSVLVVVVALLAPVTAAAQSIVGVLGIPAEIAPVEQRLEGRTEQTIRGHVFRLGTIGGQRVVVGRTAAGKVNAAIVATLLIDHFNPSALFFSGTAGGLDPALHPGDIVIGASTAQHDLGRQTAQGIARRGPRDTVTGELHPLLSPAPPPLLAAARRVLPQLKLPSLQTTEGVRAPRVVEGVIVTGDVFLADAARGEEMRKTLGAAAVEMEGAAMVQVCTQFKVSCLVVRSITDRADAGAQESYQAFIKAASDNAASLVVAIIGQVSASGR